MRIEWVKCGCDNGYTGPYGVTCSRCEGSGWREEIVPDEGDCPRCNGFGKVTKPLIMDRLFPCPLNCGSTGHKQV